tara:strand:+ start:1202 stop:2818 length:1617 start_codon:yes stop_codon:yes gene_type:complete
LDNNCIYSIGDHRCCQDKKTKYIGEYNINIGEIISRHAKYRPNHTAVVFGGKKLSYVAFNDQVNALANGLLDAGITKGDKIATVLPNSIELLILYWAAPKIGAVIVPMSPLLQPAGISKLAIQSDAKMIMTSSSYVSIVEQAVQNISGISKDCVIITGDISVKNFRRYKDLVSKTTNEPPKASIKGEDIYNIIFSSGTTGEPKGIIHTHYIRAMYCALLSQAFRYKPESISLHTGSVIFNGAFLTLMPSFFNGGTFILHETFSVDKMIETIQKEKVTHIAMVPSQITALLNHPNIKRNQLESLEMLLSVGAPLHLSQKKQLLELIPNRFYELYGITEGFMTLLDKTDAKRKMGSVGSCTPFFNMRICNDKGDDLEPGEIGEIVGNSPLTMPGYYKRPNETKKILRDGWLFTGDLGYVDEEGFLFLVDRKKDMIITGGVNVYPKDIEEIVMHHPSVVEVAVFGVSDEKWGETPVAAIILKSAEKNTEIEIKDWINSNVHAKYQRVSKVIIKKDFPRNVAGKILKRVMREEFNTEAVFDV